jgi:hypothetical protein
MFQGEQGQFAARALTGCRPKAAGAVENSSDNSCRIQRKPGAASKTILTGKHIWSVGPMPPGRLGGAGKNFIAVGAQ